MVLTSSLVWDVHIQDILMWRSASGQVGEEERMSFHYQSYRVAESFHSLLTNFPSLEQSGATSVAWGKIKFYRTLLLSSICVRYAIKIMTLFKHQKGHAFAHDQVQCQHYNYHKKRTHKKNTNLLHLLHLHWMKAFLIWVVTWLQYTPLNSLLAPLEGQGIGILSMYWILVWLYDFK